MKELEIIDINNFDYTLKDENDKEYIFNLEFLDIDESLNVGDKIEFSKDLINPNFDGYSLSYTFGNMDNKYGRLNAKLGDYDVIVLEKDGKEILLKRLYG
jgi:hypothetical protein